MPRRPITPNQHQHDPMEEEDLSDAFSEVISPPQGFRMLYHKMLPPPARPGLAAWSPQLDLFAVVTNNDNVLLFRMNGQRVWGVAHNLGDGVHGTVLRWRPDGKMLALGYSNGVTLIFDVNNGKRIHNINSEVSNFAAITCMGWIDNHSHLLVGNAPLETKSAECTPQALCDLDIGTMLPRLSVLPNTSGPDSTFTSKTTLDALINTVTKGGEGTHLDLLLIGDESGKILVNVFESFLIGTMELSSLSHHVKRGSRLIGHAASVDLSTHPLILSEPGTDNVLFTTMDILFIHQFGQYLFQLASTSNHVQSLITYMRETVTAIEFEFKAMTAIATKYVNLVEEESEKVGSDACLEFFEFLVTGGPSPVLKEFLIDCLTERGQKKWEKSGLSGYETLRRLVHECLLPAAERLTICFTRLRGLARWKESGSPLGLEPDDFTRCLEVVSGVILYAHEFILKIGHELDLYRSFMKWLRHSMDHIATIINIEDKPTEDPQVDTLKVSDYIANFLKKSSLHRFLKRDTEPKLSKYKERGESIIELYSKKEKSENAPGFMELVEYLQELCQTVFSKPQRSMRQQLRISKPVLICEGKLDQSIIKVLESDKRHPESDKAPVAYMILYAAQDAEKFIVAVRCEIDIKGGLSSASKIECSKVSIPDEEGLDDVQFVDDCLFIMTTSDKAAKTTHLTTMDYTTINYTEGFNIASKQSIFAYGSSLEVQRVEAVARRDMESNWVGSQVIVNGKVGRRVGCVVGNDTGYFVFDIDHIEDDDESEPPAPALDDSSDEEESMEMDEDTFQR